MKEQFKKVSDAFEKVCRLTLIAKDQIGRTYITDDNVITPIQDSLNELASELEVLSRLSDNENSAFLKTGPFTSTITKKDGINS